MTAMYYVKQLMLCTETMKTTFLFMILLLSMDVESWNIKANFRVNIAEIDFGYFSFNTLEI